MKNYKGIWAIYSFEMRRSFRTIGQTIASPVISTMLYFLVFGSAMGHHIGDIDGMSYSAFIVPGLIMMTILGETISNASFGIYFPRFTGTIYEILSAPLSFVEITIGYVGAAAAKSIIIASVVLLTSSFFVPIEIKHPIFMTMFLLSTCITFGLLGFILGIWADGFEKLKLIPLLIITPLTFLGGSFYSITMLPEFWQKVSLFNPIIYLVSGLRWSFYETSDINLGISISMILVFLTLFVIIIAWMFKTGYKLKN